jgi:transcriptional regulator with XRE-family HTH domain
MARKKENKSAKIRALLDKGLLQRDIVKKLGVSQQLVYIVARNHGALNDTQSSIAKKLGISGKKYASKRAGGTSKDQKFISKLLALVDAYRKGK